MVAVLATEERPRIVGVSFFVPISVVTSLLGLHFQHRFV